MNHRGENTKPETRSDGAYWEEGKKKRTNIYITTLPSRLGRSSVFFSDSHHTLTERAVAVILGREYHHSRLIQSRCDTPLYATLTHSLTHSFTLFSFDCQLRPEAYSQYLPTYSTDLSLPFHTHHVARIPTNPPRCLLRGIDCCWSGIQC